jgi:DNA polymerase III delta prime subunit
MLAHGPIRFSESQGGASIPGMGNYRWPQTGCILFVHRDFNVARNRALDYAEERLSTHSNTSAKALMQAGTHPDFRYVEPAVGSQWITMDVIRELSEWATHKPLLSQRRVAIITAAHALNRQAGNALLKTLEESSEETLFILLTHQPALVLATLRSRCYRSDLHSPDQTQASIAQCVPWMQADLRTLSEGGTDPLTLGRQWLAKEGLQDLLDGFWGVLVAMQQDYATEGKLICRRDWWSLVDKLLQAKQSLSEGAAINEGLLLGSLLIEYAAIMTQKDC